MYKSGMEIRKDINPNRLDQLASIAERAFRNRAGRVKNVSLTPYCLSFEGGEKDYGCLELGMLTLKREKSFLECLSDWHWIDEDPDECCDLLQLFKG